MAAPTTDAPVTLSTLTTRAQIEAYLTSLTRLESTLDERLTLLISSTDQLDSELSKLTNLNEVVRTIKDRSIDLSDKISLVADTAQRVGGKVRILDQEQSRVKESIEYVQATQDLKTSLSALDASIQKHDWETATRYIQRLNAIDSKIIHSKFAEVVVPTADLPSTPPTALQTFKMSLLTTFLESFRAAAHSGDTNNINRFFKLFPMIGEEEKGLAVYAEWVADIVKNKAGQSAVGGKNSSPTHFSTLLTNLFESIALIVSQHQPVVEKYYGSSKMIPVVETLLNQVDRLGLQILLSWEEERRVRKKLIESRESRFHGLNLTNLKKASGGTGGGTGLIGGVVNTGTITASSIITPLTRPASPVPSGQYQQEIEGGLDPREIDALLVETSMISGRWQLLRRFLYDRLKDDEEEIEEKPNSHKLEERETKTIKVTIDEGDSNEAEEQEEDQNSLPMVEESELGQMIAEKLRAVYQPLEIWYLRSSIEKAHVMDELDLSSSPTLSSSLDDIFYILKKTLYRLISTSHITTLQNTSKEIRQVIERDVAEVWKLKMENAFKEVNSISNALGVNNVMVGGMHVNVPGGRAREEEKERKERDARAVFITYMNNLDTASDYTLRMIDEIVAGQVLSNSFFIDSELEKAKISMQSIRNLDDRFKNILRSSNEILFNQLCRPKLRPLLTEVYKDVSYVLNEDTFAEAEYRDEVRKRFIRAWENLLLGYRELFTPSNYNLFFTHSISLLVRPWESLIRSVQFTELGALKFDKDLRSIQSYLSNQAPFSSANLRESFSRLSQIAIVLTVENFEEADEVLSAVGNRLTKGEVKSVWAQRVQ